MRWALNPSTRSTGLSDSGEWNIRFDANRPSSGMVFLLEGMSAGSGRKVILRKIWERGFGFCSIGFPLNLKELD